MENSELLKKSSVFWPRMLLYLSFAARMMSSGTSGALRRVRRGATLLANS